MEVEYPKGTVSLAAGKKTKNCAEQSGTREHKEAEAGGPTSNATRKRTVRRDAGESLSSTPYKGSVQENRCKGHQKPCRFLREQCS